MAAIGKIRSWGPVLVGAIGLALFAFIAEEAFRSCESTNNDRRQQVGEVLGKKLSMQDYQKMVEEYTEMMKAQGQDNLNDDQMNQVRDYIWNNYIQTQVVADQAEKLGLTVTDEEMENILNAGTNPMLLQTPFVNQQTHRFDANALKDFLARYKSQSETNPQMAQQMQVLYKYWTFTEKTIRQQLLAQKFQSLFSHCMLSNPVEAKMAYEEGEVESTIELAAFPYSSIADNKVTISDADLKAKYDELKPRFMQYTETRDVRYVDVPVVASAADRTALQKDFEGYATELAAAEEPAQLVSKTMSSVPFLGVPVLKTAYPSDIAAQLDSIAVGSTSKVFESKMDNTLNIVRLISKEQLPDSIQFRVIQVAGTDEKQKTQADSIFNAVKGGGDFEAIAKVYGQQGEKTWLTTAQYQNAPSLSKEQKDYFTSLNTMAVNEVKNVQMTGGNLIVQVVDRKAMKDKYVAAVVKKPIDYSDDTRHAAFNKFSQFVSANTTAEDIVKNAEKNGYKVQEMKDVTTSQHNFANIRSTKDAIKWIFDAKEGTLSPMYECGDNGNHLLIVLLDKIHPQGYRDLTDERVKEYINGEVLKDKKAEQLMTQVKGVNNINAAKAKGAKVSTVEQVTFAAPVFVQTTSMSEPALSGAVAATQQGKFSTKPVKGQGGIYLFQVTNRKKIGAKFDAAAQEKKLSQRALQYAGNAMSELMNAATIVDKRYLF